MPSPQTLYHALAARQDALVDELRGYVSVESGSRDKAGVDRVGRLAAERFGALGFSVERIPEPHCGDHLVARRSGTGRGRLLALIHLDTVWPAGTLAENPFRIIDGRAYGPGVLDMKGGWVVLRAALQALDESGWDGPSSLTVFMTGDEELGSPRGRPWIERAAREADWALVMEPARENGDVVVARGMVGAVYLDVAGVTSHATFPDRGASAIRDLAHKVLELEALSDPARGVLVNVGTIEAGSARQVIPDRARASVDVRAPTPEQAETLMASIREVAARVHVPGTHATLSGGITRPAFALSSESERLFGLARQTGRELELEFGGQTARAGSDGNFTAALGVPTLDGMGPEGANGCARDEYVVLDSLPRRAALLAGIIAGLPGLLG